MLAAPTTAQTMSDPNRPKVWSYLNHDVHEYFFRKIFAGERGIKQQLITAFFDALYCECKRQGIKPEWDPESAKHVESIMSNINFHGPSKLRRAATPPPKHSKESTSDPYVGLGLDGISD